MSQSLSLQYCIVATVNKFFSDNVKVKINFGDANDLLAQYDKQLMAETVKAEQFYNLADIFNYLYSVGWDYVQALPLDAYVEGNTSNIKQYMFQRRQ